MIILKFCLLKIHLVLCYVGMNPFILRLFRPPPMPKSTLLCLSTYVYLLSSYILEYLNLYLLAFLDIFSICTSRLSNESCFMVLLLTALLLSCTPLVFSLYLMPMIYSLPLGYGISYLLSSVDFFFKFFFRPFLKYFGDS